MQENAAAADMKLAPDERRRLEQIVSPAAITGDRYDAKFALTLDSETE
jgi:hypothetical protein